MGDVIFLNKSGEKVMKESIFEVAKFFLAMESMNHKKLQKLCYYAQAWHLGIYKTGLMNTYFEAWVHGPVSPELYARYRDWGGLRITGSHAIPELSQSTQDFLRKIYSLYGKYSADTLEEFTHNEEPWKLARVGFKKDSPCKNIISEESMKKYYSELIGV